MAVEPDSGSNHQVAVTLMERFLSCVPSYFTYNQNDKKLHHDVRKVNVFAHDSSIFGDSFGEVLKVEGVEDLALMKQRLLTQPIYLKVTLTKRRKSGNTTYINKGTFVVYINSSHPFIQNQLKQSIEAAQQKMAEGKNFALEVDFGPVLKAWYKTRFEDNRGGYEADGANFCVTNFGQKCHLCYNPFMWVGCLPFMLVLGPPYCIYRSLATEDTTCAVQAAVQYVEGLSHTERSQLARMLTQAYVQGLNNRPEPQQAQPAKPPSYDDQAPPPYSALNNPPTGNLI